MSNTENIQVIYTQIPEGLPCFKTNFKVAKSSIDLQHVNLKENQLLLKTLYLSVDPYMRFRMRDPTIKSYFKALSPGDIMEGGAVCKVLQSLSQDFKIGDIVVTGNTKWESYTIASTDFVQKIPSEPHGTIPLSYYLGILGMPGLTAYSGVNRIAEPQPNETIFISAASGAVGQVVGQYCKSKGLRVVGSAGTDEKVKFLVDELKFDSAFNYKKSKDFEADLKAHCPSGIDIYFENVGGSTLDAVLKVANEHARIPVCGMVSQYNSLDSPEPIYNMTNVIAKRIKLQGFLVTDYYESDRQKFLEEFRDLIQKGKLLYKESVVDGIENAAQAFIDMLEGKNFGKQVVKVSDL